MSRLPVEPLPFRLPLPGRDTLGFDGARSVWYRIHGLLHFDGNTLTFEWSAMRHLEQVSFTGVSVRDDTLPPELVELPATLITEARLTGGWWAPRLRLRARHLDAFDALPAAAPGAIVLRIARRDRALAAAMVEALNPSRAVGPAQSRRELLP